MPVAIKVENLSKAYQLGEIGTGTISRDLERWFAKLRGKEDPFLKIGETNDRATKGASNVVWSLKDINFEIQQGDAVGIIGRNGAGKSTLLKILSRVTSPTIGTVKAKGRIASLLEVGTGFHPELTGRENIFLNGAILGMRKREIARKFDEIVDFAGVERYIDTPVKRYSSGMYVRLAFAVAAYLESEILIVDEVLAVGDAEFQRKCLNKMGDVSKGEGRTVLFVSHSMSSIKTFCNRGILINNGEIENTGTVYQIVQEYFHLLKHQASSHYISKTNSENKISQVYLLNSVGEMLTNITSDLKQVFLVFEVDNKSSSNINLGATIYNSEGLPLLSTAVLDTIDRMKIGYAKYAIELPISFFKADEYNLEAMLWDNNKVYETGESYIKFKVDVRSKLEIAGQGVKGLFINPNKWYIKN